MRILLLFALFVGYTQGLLAQTEQNGAVIFIYHRFGESRYPSTSIKMEQFRFQLEYLKTHHYNVWPLSKIIQTLKEQKPLPPKTVALTIDDAYKSVYTHAYPLLKQYSFPFTVFVNTNPVDNASKNYMSWDEMREMKRNGAEFGNHTVSHPSFLTFLDLDESKMQAKIKRELEYAQKRLQQELAVKTKMVAYPFGEYTNKIRGFVSSLGYAACTQVGGVLTHSSELAEIPRFPMSQRFATKEGFLTKLQTKALPLAAPPKSDHLVMQNPPKLQLTLQRPLKGIGCYLSSGERIRISKSDAIHLSIQAKEALQPPRDHYTCTAPASKGRWYWYSFLWVFPKKNY